MNRRKFITGGLAGLACLAATFALWRWRFPRGYRRAAVPETLARFVDIRMIVKIGDSYRQTNRLEFDAKTLERLIDGDGDDASGGRGSIEDRIRDDFRQNQVLQLHGWLLSRTEARQCALFSVLYHD